VKSNLHILHLADILVEHPFCYCEVFKGLFHCVIQRLVFSTLFTCIYFQNHRHKTLRNWCVHRGIIHALLKSASLDQRSKNCAFSGARLDLREGSHLGLCNSVGARMVFAVGTKILLFVTQVSSHCATIYLVFVHGRKKGAGPPQAGGPVVPGPHI